MCGNCCIKIIDKICDIADKCTFFPSLRENKAKELMQSSPENFVKFTQRQISKIYPLGTRTDSSNLKPYPFWSVGAQVGMYLII